MSDHSTPESLLSDLAGRKTYPVMDWNPSLCGHIDIRIDHEGAWWHEGRPMVRQSMIDLFSQLLKKEGEDYYLVTPVEKLRIIVDDLPLRIVDIGFQDGHIRVVTAQGEAVVIGEGHELVFDGDAEEPKPRIRVRHDLWARFSRPAYYRLFEAARVEAADNTIRVSLAGQTFDLAGGQG